MRYLTADFLYPLNQKPIEKGVLQITKSGIIVNIYSDRRLVDKNKLEFFKGILCPGFVNAHCHLELSYLHQVIKQHTGLIGFFKSIKKNRDLFSQKEILSCIDKAESQMLKNGIVGVGDICNTKNTLSQKLNNNLTYYNFIETFQVDDSKVLSTFNNALEIKKAFTQKNQRAAIVPHSPFTVPPSLMKKILNELTSSDVSSIHINESIYEKELFEKKQGQLLDWLVSIGADQKIWKKRNTEYDILKKIKQNNWILVHNTYSDYIEFENCYYCTCPKANLYIENQLPNYSIFNVDKLCVGTDSLASNNSLSILEELLIIKKNSHFSTDELLRIASKNGAEALGFSKLGTFDIGKKPGVNLIKDFNSLNLEVII